MLWTFSADCCSAHFSFSAPRLLSRNLMMAVEIHLVMKLEGQTASADLLPAASLESASKISRLMFAWPLVVSRNPRA
ncbi:MAG: hypothetical protein VX109_03760 [Planctomycetota bacterium]|nr:hypothetical protein [Planctomycetota bacterium]